jgi:hypothetical protein
MINDGSIPITSPLDPPVLLDLSMINRLSHSMMIILEYLRYYLV